jgi:hypothetical protein
MTVVHAMDPETGLFCYVSVFAVHQSYSYVQIELSSEKK